MSVFSPGLAGLHQITAGYSVVTSSTRPGSPSDGDFIYETDTGYVLWYDGANWLPPANVAWGLYLEGESITLRSDRQYLVTGTITSQPDDLVGTGGNTRMQLTCTYDSVEQAKYRQWTYDATDAQAANIWSFSFFVTGDDAAADMTFSLADSLGRGYDSTHVSDYCRYTITDVGPT
jgi:hypothetical protein